MKTAEHVAARFNNSFENLKCKPISHQRVDLHSTTNSIQFAESNHDNGHFVICVAFDTTLKLLQFFFIRLQVKSHHFLFHLVGMKVTLCMRFIHNRTWAKISSVVNALLR